MDNFILVEKKHLHRNKSSNDVINQISIIKKLFPPLKLHHKYKLLKIDSDSICCISKPQEAQICCEFIIENMDKISIDRIDNWSHISNAERALKMIITDITAGVGGNTLCFAKYFKYVNAIEIVFPRYMMLLNNIKVYEILNINSYNGDSIPFILNDNKILQDPEPQISNNIFGGINQDIVFCDPPWGGKGYKLKTNIKLTINNISIELLANELLEKNKCQMVVYKLPNNYDMEFFRINIKFPFFTKILSNMTIIVIVKFFQKLSQKSQQKLLNLPSLDSISIPISTITPYIVDNISDDELEQTLDDEIIIKIDPMETAKSDK